MASSGARGRADTGLDSPSPRRRGPEVALAIGLGARHARGSDEPRNTSTCRRSAARGALGLSGRHAPRDPRQSPRKADHVPLRIATTVGHRLTCSNGSHGSFGCSDVRSGDVRRTIDVRHGSTTSWMRTRRSTGLRRGERNDERTLRHRRVQAAEVWRGQRGKRTLLRRRVGSATVEVGAARATCDRDHSTKVGVEKIGLYGATDAPPTPNSDARAASGVWFRNA